MLTPVREEGLPLICYNAFMAALRQIGTAAERPEGDVVALVRCCG